VPRLRRSDPGGAGLARRRSGRGFCYLGPDGARITDPELVARIRSLAIPPAWSDVWICADPMGHIQAVGTDAAGRRQYRYHDLWRERRDREKFQRVLALGRGLPALRRGWQRELCRSGLDRDRVLAAAATLLDLGLFRVGGEEYAAENGTFGLATLRRDHVRVRSGTLVFDYLAKGGQRRVETVSHPALLDVVVALRRRRDPNPELFAYRQDGRWCDLRSGPINDYLRTVSTLDVTAKDFRTWHGTTLMAAALAEHTPVSRSRTARRRAVTWAYLQVSEALGNTPAVCRASYVDPRLVDRYHDGVTVDPDRIGRNPRIFRTTLEREVLRLLTE
jgi:DNA topoisomerase IB